MRTLQKVSTDAKAFHAANYERLTVENGNRDCVLDFDMNGSSEITRNVAPLFARIKTGVGLLVRQDCKNSSCYILENASCMSLNTRNSIGYFLFTQPYNKSN